MLQILRESVLPWAPMVATLIGWAVVNSQNNKREARKEERSLIDGAKKLAVDVAAKARAYMCTAKRDVEEEANIKWLLDQLEIEIGRMPGYKANKALVSAVSELSDSATGGDFESATRTARNPHDPEVGRLIRARNNLLLLLEKDFRTRYLD